MHICPCFGMSIVVSDDGEHGMGIAAKGILLMG